MRSAIILRNIVAAFSKKVSHFAQYFLLRTVQLLLVIIPRRPALFLGSILGYVLYLLGAYRRIVRKNMEYTALWDDATTNRITRSLYKNFGRYAVDFLRPTYPLPKYTLHDYEKIEPLFHEGKGTIAILGHIGNWEMLATVFGTMTGKLNVVAKTMSNPFVDKWLLAKRTASSVTTIYSNQALRKMISVLRSDGIIAILIDQYMRNHGNPVPFLSKPSKTVNTVAGLAVKTGCNVVSIKAIMRTDGTYDITAYRLPDEELSGLSEEDKIFTTQQRHNDLLSQRIMEHPDHWFGWFHKRFRGYVSYKRDASR
jgi:Kdo2-lipid IVA lauroyltransferase/acyltransferase